MGAITLPDNVLTARDLAATTAHALTNISAASDITTALAEAAVNRSLAESDAQEKLQQKREQLARQVAMTQKLQGEFYNMQV